MFTVHKIDVMEDQKKKSLFPSYKSVVLQNVKDKLLSPVMIFQYRINTFTYRI